MAIELTNVRRPPIPLDFCGPGRKSIRQIKVERNGANGRVGARVRNHLSREAITLRPGVPELVDNSWEGTADYTRLVKRLRWVRARKVEDTTLVQPVGKPDPKPMNKEDSDTTGDSLFPTVSKKRGK